MRVEVADGKRDDEGLLSWIPFLFCATSGAHGGCGRYPPVWGTAIRWQGGCRRVVAPPGAGVEKSF